MAALPLQEAWSGLGDDGPHVEGAFALAADHDGVHVVVAVLVMEHERRALGPGQPLASIIFSTGSEQASPGGDSTWLSVYADERLIRSPGLDEQRLTADGVERLRQEILATGVFDNAGPQAGDTRVWYSCLCIIRVRVNGELRDTDTGYFGTSISAYDRGLRHEPGYSEPSITDPQLDARLRRLTDFVADLESSLPPTAWAEREAKPYVPPKYVMALWMEDSNVSQAVPDVSGLLRQLLPTPLVDRIDAEGWMHATQGDAVIVDLADVRELVEGLGWAGPSAGGRSRVLRPGEVPGSPSPTIQVPYSWIQLSLTPILPDGQSAVAPPCPICP